MGGGVWTLPPSYFTPPPRRRGEGGGEGQRQVQDPVVDKIVAHLARVASDEVPDMARAAAKAFIADTLGVGIAGATAPWRREVLNMAAASGSAEATVWGSDARLPLAAAA